MSVILFIIILAVLVFVHELGHFLVAKRSGIKVSEFGIGFPPKIWSKQHGETLYTINAIPFGGFVKIMGEDAVENPTEEDRERSMVAKPKYIQVAVLAAGVFFNLLFAWFLISVGFMIGQPTGVDYTGPGQVINPALVITMIAPESPALAGGLQPGDVIVGVESGKNKIDEVTAENISKFINAYGRDGIQFQVTRGDTPVALQPIVAKEGIVTDKLAVGISMDMIGTLRLGPIDAFWMGLVKTYDSFVGTAKGLLSFLGKSIQGNGSLSEVTGPVGIVGVVGQVSELGFVYLLMFTALISINLAVINLFPFPALDGGRILFVIIEAIIRKPIPAKFANYANGIGFSLLIFLMLVVTAHDIWKLF